MKKHYPLILFVLTVVATSIVFEVSDDFIIKFISGTIAAVGISIKPLRRRFDSINNKIEDLRSRHQLLALFLEKIEKKQILKDDVFVSSMVVIVESNIKLLNQFEQKRIDSSLSVIDIVIDSKEKLSRNRNYNILNWRDTTQKQFTTITGRSGSGKSFELRNRFEYYTKQLIEKINSNKSTSANELKSNEVTNAYKIPIYIELKSLRQPLDKDWIRDYIKSHIRQFGNGNPIKDEHIDLIIENNEIVYFLDAVDEIDLSYREQALAEIVKLSNSTSIFFTCRTEVYEELRFKRNHHTKIKGDELVPPYLEPLEIKLSPLSDDYIELIIKSHKFEGLENNFKDNKEFVIELQNEIISYIRFSTPTFKEQLSTPVFFNLFITVFPEFTETDKKILSSGNEEDNLNFLWSYYEDKESKIYDNNVKNLDAKALSIYTIWIAKIVGTSSFSAESIQPNWLHRIIENNKTEVSKWLQKCYFLITRIFAAVVIGIGMGCILSTPLTFLSNSVFGGVIIAIVAGWYKYKVEGNNPTRFLNVLFSFFLFAFLIVGCGLFQGLSVPRAEEEITYYFFPEAYSGILLGIALGANFSYRIIKEKKAKQYILPVERFHFNWMKALQYGITVGITSGILVGGIAVTIKKGQTNSFFFNNWLLPHIDRIVSIFYSGQLEGEYLDIAIFFYGFICMFIVASLLITVLVGPYNEVDFQHEIDRQNLNFNIRKSAAKAFINAIQIALSIFIIYLFIFLMVKQQIGGFYFATKIAIGFFVLGFFWYGGMEVFNFTILKRKLHMLGIIPLNYENWREKYQKLGLITTSGKEMKFYHDSVARFYQNYKGNHLISINDTYKPRKANLAISIFICLFLFLLVYPFISRYQLKQYWQNSHNIEMVSNDLMQSEHNNVFVCQKSGNLQLEASGSIHVGTFVGRVFPHGTEHGFFGIEMDSAYNVPGLGHFRHSALLIRTMKVKDDKWSDYEYLSNSFKEKEKLFYVEKGDKLEFIINDKEWQNNISTFKVSASIN